MSGEALQRVLAALERGGGRWRHQSGGYMAQCPAHDDQRASLKIDHEHGQVLLRCHTGCAAESVVHNLGLTMADLFDPDQNGHRPVARPAIVATYDYQDANRNLLYQKVRYVPKDFRVRRPDPSGGWIWNIGDDTPRVLYRLPDVIEAMARGETIFIAEGERDVDRLVELGHCGTCNYDGASKDTQRSKWREIYSDTLIGAHVVIIADNDAAGFAHARSALRSLTGKATTVKIVRGAVDTPHADISDHLDAGHSISELVAVNPDDKPAGTETDGDPDGEDSTAGELVFQREVAQELRRIQVRAEARRQFAEQDESPSETTRFVTGGAFIHDAPDHVPAIWGRGEEVLWSQGEPLMITGPTGVGKTTLGGQVVAGRIGLIPEVLGYPVVSGERLLYLAMDRPAQIARALARCFRQYPREILDERLVVWRGPPPADLAANPSALLQLAHRAGADTVVLDSLKDAAVKLSDEEVGQGLNRALQLCIAAGIEVIGYHHQTKRGAGGLTKPNSLADVYGSGWITAGCGSVLLLWGEAGDPIVELSHLKQPAAEVGPIQVIHDTGTGAVGVLEGGDVLDILLAGPRTASEVAVALYGALKPSNAQIEKARRKIQKLVAKGLALRLGDPSTGGAVAGRKGGGDGARYAALHRVERSSESPHASVHAPSPETSFPQVEHPTGMINPDRSTTNAENRPTSPHEKNVSAGQTPHASPHAQSTPLRPTLPSPPLGGGVGKRGDHEVECGARSEPDGGGDKWVLAHLTTRPQTVDRLVADLDATPQAVEPALRRLQAAGLAQEDPRGWSLPRDRSGGS